MRVVRAAIFVRCEAKGVSACAGAEQLGRKSLMNMNVKVIFILTHR